MKERRNKRGWYRFWIKSNRGTDSSTFKFYAEPRYKCEIKDDLEQWCSGFGCWDMSESMVRYGVEKKRPPIAVIRKQAENARRGVEKAKQAAALLESELARRTK
jgi:hypothetical protein